MKQRCPLVIQLSVLLVLLLIAGSVEAATVQIPEWFGLTVGMADPPELGKAVTINVKLQMLIGEVSHAKIRLILPESWKSEPEILTSGLIKEGSNMEMTFNVTPGSCLNQGSIVVEAVMLAPKTAIINHIKKEFPESAEGMVAAVNAWPDETKRFADIAFALFADESFFPLTGDMWLSYDDSLAPAKGFRGPAYFEDTLISTHQAQTDVEMFAKLKTLLETDLTFADKLAESGIDINKKQQDQLNGLYVLAVKAWQEKRFAESTGFIEQFEKCIDQDKADSFAGLKIAAANLKGLIFWSQGQKRLAEEALKKAFYARRKHPLQRYVLRNIGLLMLSNSDRDTAARMYELAMPYKKGFTLLENEMKLLKKN